MDAQEDIFSNLPPEIILSILSRIPIKTVSTCKCVRKSWLELLESPEFARSHLSNSVPGLLINKCTNSNVFKIFEFEESPEIRRHELHYKPVLELSIEENFDLSNVSRTSVEGSANGLLFMRNARPQHTDYYVCNPITRECIRLPEPEGIYQNGTALNFGFGVSRLSNQFKVVRILHDCIRDHPNKGYSLLGIPKSVWQVYTLGTESWRDFTTPSEMLLDYTLCSSGKLLNGNLYWLAPDLNGSKWISCFDLETEVFTKFQAPIGGYLVDTGVLRDRLCLCDNSSETEISIYLMSDYGDENKHWSREYVIRKNPRLVGKACDLVCAVKAFGDGDLLLAWIHTFLFCYSNWTKTTELLDTLDVFNSGYVQAMLYTPSFISLKDFKTENAKKTA